MERFMEKANIIDRFRLDGKVALVTGGSGYYGKQMVIALGRRWRHCLLRFPRSGEVPGIYRQFERGRI